MVFGTFLARPQKKVVSVAVFSKIENFYWLNQQISGVCLFFSPKNQLPPYQVYLYWLTRDYLISCHFSRLPLLESSGQARSMGTPITFVGALEDPQQSKIFFSTILLGVPSFFIEPQAPGPKRKSRTLQILLLYFILG